MAEYFFNDFLAGGATARASIGVSSTGPTGAVGATGPTGVAGATGNDGQQGIQGTAGSPGSQGTAGSAGSNGATGPTGIQGVQGTAGSQGAQGTAGASGANGVTGPTGIQGIQGTAGTNAVLTGATGIQGVTGPTGSQGIQGTAGNAGSNGSAGATGPTGPTSPATIPAMMRVVSQTSDGPTPAPNADTTDFYEISAATGNVTFGVPAGTPINGQRLSIRFSSSNLATGRTIAWSTATGGYAASLAPAILPAVCTTGKSAFVDLVYNSNQVPPKWRAIIGATGQ